MTRKEEKIQSLSTSLSTTSQRKFLLILLKNADRQNLDPQDILSRVRSAWECQSVVITKQKSDSGGFHFLIGLHTLKASKHVYSKKIKQMFSEFPEAECQVKSVKGAGTWSSSLTSFINKPVLVFGESTMQELIELARASQQHKKAKISAEPAPKKAKKYEKQKKKKFFWLRTSLKKGYWQFKRWTFSIVEQVIKTLIKGILGICLYIYFKKILQIDQIDPKFFTSMTSIWELMHFLLGGVPPENPIPIKEWTLFVFGLTCLYALCKFFKEG